MSWLDAFFTSYNTVQANGAALPQRQVLDFGAAFSVTDDVANQRTVVSGLATAVLVVVAVAGGVTYTSASSQLLAEADSSNDLQPVIKCSATPSQGDVVAVAWLNWDPLDASLGAHKPLVDGNGKNLVPFGGMSAPNTYVSTTTVDTPGATGRWTYDGTQWVL